jgi:hypothetical protein
MLLLFIDFFISMKGTEPVVGYLSSLHIRCFWRRSLLVLSSSYVAPLRAFNLMAHSGSWSVQ